MVNIRKYGREPFRIAVIHGGPGAGGEMAPVARELSSMRGVLEPLQTATTVEGQVHELKGVLEKHAALPVILAGFSWGAFLSFIFTASYPSFVAKLILIGSAPYEEKYARNITRTRLDRLGEKDRAEALSLMESLNDPSAAGKNSLMSRLGKLLARADAYDPLPDEDEMPECRYDVFQGVWEQASELRRSGKLLEVGKGIGCPVVALHGDYDPHPAAGGRSPFPGLSRISALFY